jgi:RHS repeat-associated protein
LPQVISERTDGLNTFHWAGIGQQTNRLWAFHLSDGLGSVRHLTDLTGKVRSSTTYDPFGKPISSWGNLSSTFGFTGEQTDTNGLVYLRARYYAPSIGSFLSRDPVEGVAGRSMSRNGYAYAEGNPVNYTDPSGEFPFLFAGLALLAGGLTFGGLPAALEWRIAHDCQCGVYLLMLGTCRQV